MTKSLSMTEPTNAELIREAEELDRKATPGEWCVWSQQPDVQVRKPNSIVKICDVDTWTGKGVIDAEFIARSRTLVPLLAQRLKQAAAIIQRADLELHDDCGGCLHCKAIYAEMRKVWK